MAADASGPSSPDAVQPDVLDEVRMRAILASLISSAAVIVLLVVYALIPGHYSLAPAPYFALTGTGALAVLASARLPWRSLIRHPWFVQILVGWSIADIALVSAGIAVSGGSHSDLYLLYLAMTVFMAGVSYPRSTRVALVLLLMASYVITLGALGWNIGAGTILLRLGIIVITAAGANATSIALTRELYFRDQVTRDSEARAGMWSRVAGLGREIGLLDEEQLLTWAVDAVYELGFEAANVCMYSEDLLSYHVAHARGLPDEYAQSVHSSERGMAHFVKGDRKTVVVTDYSERSDGVPLLVASGFRTVVATPVWVEGELTAALVGGTRTKRPVKAEEIAAIELLAAHAGRGIENARKVEHQRRDAAHFRSLITSAPDAMVVMDIEGHVLEANRQIGRLFGYDLDELTGMSIEQFVPRSFGHFAELYREAFAENPRTLVVGETETLTGLRKDGSEFPMEVVLGPIEAPEGLLVTATVRDVTERKEFERRLAHQATHDHLTGLPNRAQFVGKLAEALARTPVGSSQIGVCFLDVDHFKYVNDSRGHTVGDELVAEVARRIASTARAGDLVARFGGDEFAVLVEGLTDRQGAVAHAWRLLASFDRPFVLEGVECYLTASVGIAFGARGDNPNDLLRDADAAMYQAKQKGRARVELFDDTLTARARERLEIESALHQALLGEQLSLVFQPVAELSSRSVIGAEALLRWEHPERGPIPPSVFIPIAEESGLILQLGRWVLTRACQHAARWVRQGLVPADFEVSVNVSNRQLEHDRLIAEVASILESTGLPSRNLVVEVTESFFMRDLHAAVRRLNALKQLGVRIAIDDFGTGFSSLNSLSRLPIDVVKIDKSFTDALGTRNDAIIGAVVEVAGAFDLEVVAEGVESEDQVERLLGLGCKLGQGYLLGRPVPTHGIERVLSARAGAAG
ncbi:MAG TPA: EAL domain-containing protein [Acidimicrobiales bacterium]|nr:EAL domain-containing protein [Acidimicrobiales bacterium]